MVSYLEHERRVRCGLFWINFLWNRLIDSTSPDRLICSSACDEQIYSDIFFSIKTEYSKSDSIRFGRNEFQLKFNYCYSHLINLSSSITREKKLVAVSNCLTFTFKCKHSIDGGEWSEDFLSLTKQFNWLADQRKWNKSSPFGTFIWFCVLKSWHESARARVKPHDYLCFPHYGTNMPTHVFFSLLLCNCLRLCSPHSI